jgi:hypothetical protein
MSNSNRTGSNLRAVNGSSPLVRLPLLMPAASELERAGDPEITCVEADDLVPGVKDAAVTGPRTPQWDRFDVTRWRYAIPGRHYVLCAYFSRIPLEHSAMIIPYVSA